MKLDLIGLRSALIMDLVIESDKLDPKSLGLLTCVYSGLRLEITSKSRPITLEFLILRDL